jgi:hypothetical protein
MINGANMSLQITEKPSFDTTASTKTKALMVRNQYQEASMLHDDVIRLHIWVIIHVHELNYPILKRDTGITHWKSVELSRT